MTTEIKCEEKGARCITCGQVARGTLEDMQRWCENHAYTHGHGAVLTD